MNYQRAFNYLVDNLEGDSGKPSVYGDTYGIKPSTWDEWCKSLHVSPTPITRAGAYSFYRESYWLPLGCDNLPHGLDFCLFEWAVNGEGPGRRGQAVRDLQTCLGVLPDGIMGPETLHAATSCDRTKTMTLFLARQVGQYIDDAKKNPDAPLVGWENRVRKTCKIVGVDPTHAGLS